MKKAIPLILTFSLVVMSINCASWSKTAKEQRLGLPVGL
jgi:hypothetical protein